MTKRPEEMDREEWLAGRARIWRRRNWIINGLMWVTIVVLVVRYCA